MKRSVLLMFAFVSQSVWAQPCVDKLTDVNWPSYKLEFVLDCNRSKVTMGETYDFEEKLCVGLETHGDEGSLTYKVIRTDPKYQFGLALYVSRRASGEVVEGAHIKQRGDKLAVGDKRYSFEFGQKWIDEAVLDPDLKTVTFNVYDDGFFFDTLKRSTIYTCDRVK